MTLKLVSSNDHLALAIRDHVLPMVRAHGTLGEQWGGLRRITLSMEPWSFSHWTPFKELASGEASSPGYRHAVAEQRERPTLDYGLDILHDGARMLGLIWSDDGSFAVNAFVRGDWEAQVRELTGPEPSPAEPSSPEPSSGEPANDKPN